MYSSWFPASEQGSLFIRHNFDQYEYTVQFTDLRVVLEEHLTENNILKRASDTESSVDPSDDAKQFGFLLKKLQAALDGDKGTTLSIPDVFTGKYPSTLDISITSVLPHGIPDLTWTFHLRQTNPDTLRSEVIAPLLGLICTEQQRILELVNVIREKDTVITRILDKFDSTGIDFTNIFPTAGVVKHRKGNQTESFRKAVKGLAEFDEADWQKQSLESSSERTPTSRSEMIVKSLKNLNRPAVLTNTNHILDEGVHVERQENTEQKEPTPPPKLETQESNVSTDDFQRQTPPPKFSADEETPSPAREEESTHIREESAVIESLRPPTTKPERKIGTLGGRRLEVDQEEPLPSTDEHEKVSYSKEANTNVPIAQGRPKLGQRGGPKPQEQPESTDTTVENLDEASPKPRRGKVGQLGGRRRQTERKVSPEPISRVNDEGKVSSNIKLESQSQSNELVAHASDRPSKLTDVSEDADEDPTERANRRREELKRQMEEKTKTQTKKKRRF